MLTSGTDANMSTLISKETAMKLYLGHKLDHC